MGGKRSGVRGPMVRSRWLRRLWAASLHALGLVAWPLSYLFPGVTEAMARHWMRFAMDAEERRRELARDLHDARKQAAATEREEREG